MYLFFVCILCRKGATLHCRYCLDSWVTRRRVTISKPESESESKWKKLDSSPSHQKLDSSPSPYSSHTALICMQVTIWLDLGVIRSKVIAVIVYMKMACFSIKTISWLLYAYGTDNYLINIHVYENLPWMYDIFQIRQWCQASILTEGSQESILFFMPPPTAKKIKKISGLTHKKMWDTS